MNKNDNAVDSDVVLYIFQLHVRRVSRCYPKLSFNMMYPIKGIHKMREEGDNESFFARYRNTLLPKNTSSLLINLS